MISKHTYYKFECRQPFKPNLTEHIAQFPSIGFVTPQSASDYLKENFKILFFHITIMHVTLMRNLTYTCHYSDAELKGWHERVLNTASQLEKKRNP